MVLVGGHSIEDKELKYGLSVTGFVHPERVLTKKNLQAGRSADSDQAPRHRHRQHRHQGGHGAAGARRAGDASHGRAQPHRRPRSWRDFEVHACTDVTGFGLLGHLAEMVSGSGLGVHIDSRRVPVMAEALTYASMGLIPAGAYRNREFREPMIVFAEAVERSRQDVLFDPQTSGGLLISVSGTQADDLVKALGDAGIGESAEIGAVLTGPEEKIWVV